MRRPENGERSTTPGSALGAPAEGAAVPLGLPRNIAPGGTGHGKPCPYLGNYPQPPGRAARLPRCRPEKFGFKMA